MQDTSIRSRRATRSTPTVRESDTAALGALAPIGTPEAEGAEHETDHRHTVQTWTYLDDAAERPGRQGRPVVKWIATVSREDSLTPAEFAAGRTGALVELALELTPARYAGEPWGPSRTFDLTSGAVDSFTVREFRQFVASLNAIAARLPAVPEVVHDVAAALHLEDTGDDAEGDSRPQLVAAD